MAVKVRDPRTRTNRPKLNISQELNRVIHGPSGVWIPSKDGETPGLANEIITYIALFTVAVGTGGIKPCVSALGGDQEGFQVP